MMPSDMLIDPMAEMLRFQRDMNRLLSSYCRADDVNPRVQAWADDEKAVVRAEVPGVEQGTLKVVVAGDTLTIEGERPEDVPAGLKETHRRERASGAFSRTFRLPWEADPNAVTASQKNGILTVTLPRQAASRPRTVDIKAE